MTARSLVAAVVGLALAPLVGLGAPAIAQTGSTQNIYREPTGAHGTVRDTYLVRNDRTNHNTTDLVVHSVMQGGTRTTDTRPIIDFDTNSLDSDRTIAGAQIRLTLRQPMAGEADQINMYRQNRLDWVESEADWFTYKGRDCLSGGAFCWATPGSDIVIVGEPPAASGRGEFNADNCSLGRCVVVFDAADFVLDAQIHRANHVSVTLKSESVAPLAARFYSSEANEIDYRPMLRVTYAGAGASVPCPVDITFLIDNSGSMNDHGADRNLRQLVTTLKSHFRDSYGIHRASLSYFHYDSQPNNLKTPVSYTDADSLRLALDTLKTADFGADGSGIRQPLAEINRRVIGGALSGRTQFVFFAGDEQESYPPLSDSYWNQFAASYRDHGVKFYAFALRPGPTGRRDQPFYRLAQLTGPDAAHPRYFKGAHFDDGLDGSRPAGPDNPSILDQALNADACRIQGLKFNDVNANGGRDATEPALSGWQIVLHATDSTDTREAITSADPSTLGAYEFDDLASDNRYWVEEIPSVAQANAGWRQTTPRESAQTAAPPLERPIRLIGNARSACSPGANNCSPPLATVTAVKTVSPADLTGDRHETTVTLTFTIDGGAVNSLSLAEKLAGSLVFGSTGPIQGLYTPTSGSTIPIEFDSQPAAGGRSWTARPTGSLMRFEPGSLTLSFPVVYSGPSRVDMPVELTTGDCSTSAHLEYHDPATNATQCVTLPTGALTRRNARLTLEADAALLGTNPIVFDGDSLALGTNRLFITGAPLAPRDALAVTGYDRPTTGLLAWSRLWNELTDRVTRARQTRARLLSTCPGRLAGDIYLQTDATDLNSPPRQTTEPAVWVAPDGCELELGNIVLHGSGTIIAWGGRVRATGAITSTGAADSLGIITDRVVIDDQATPNRVAFVAGGTMVLAAPGNAPASAVAYEAFFIARTLGFPRPGRLRHDITIRPSSALRQVVPPLLEQFRLPVSTFLQ